LADIDAVDTHTGRPVSDAAKRSAAPIPRAAYARDYPKDPLVLRNYPLRPLQRMQDAWASEQPWERGNGTLAFLGMIEELGEMASAIGWKAGEEPEAVRAIMLMRHLGLFAHATLKRLQKIRLNENHSKTAFEAIENLIDTAEPYGGLEDAFGCAVAAGHPRDLAQVKDAYGDLMIYAFDVGNNVPFDCQSVLEETCESVFSRDWSKYPQNGKTA
jgi:NTP pyrophosphatase (non-canonical NTP hydrolase)